MIEDKPPLPNRYACMQAAARLYTAAESWTAAAVAEGKNGSMAARAAEQCFEVAEYLESLHGGIDDIKEKQPAGAKT